MKKKNKSKKRRGTLLCYIIGHKFTLEPHENWQYFKGYVVGHCTRCDLLAIKISPFVYWNEYGESFSAHREHGRLLSILDEFGFMVDKRSEQR
jgi:hypothetical protein